MAAPHPSDQSNAAPSRFDLLLVGGGHAQLAVLADWIENDVPCAKAALVSPSRWLRYSGTVPGIISGEFPEEHGRVDLAALCERAGITLIEDRLIALDPAAHTASLASGAQLSFKLCSLDTGGVGQARRVLGECESLLDIRPIESFLDGWKAFQAREAEAEAQIAVVGGGAGGVEIAFAVRNAAGFDRQPEVTLIAGKDGLLPSFGAWPRRLVARELARQGIAVLEENAQFEQGRMQQGSRDIGPFDLIIAAVGSGAPDWPREAGMAVNKAGFVAVDEHQRSISHPHILATGDIAHRTDRHVGHAGVHAVHAGPALAANLRAAATGSDPQDIYRPRPVSLYLISTAKGHAIMSYGPMAARGRWAAKWKERIDNRWLAQYAGPIDAE